MTLATSKPPESAAFADQRSRMVEFQLRGGGISDERVLEAMSKVPREEFVPSDMLDCAYGDCPLPIGAGQTISQPFTVAFMCQALKLSGDERVLEVGTGSGYAAAVLSLLAKEVFTVERIGRLAERAKARLLQLHYDNVHVFTADGTLGLADQAPFDGIVVTAGAPELPAPYVTQLREGGRIVIPLGCAPFDQCMYRYTKHGEDLRRENLGGFAFVPLIGKHGWKGDFLR
jgi:protein-L-isoaspartate(D-aspartate) O-methyltransferase